MLIHSPPADTDKGANPGEPIPDQTTYIELAVDGHIVDLNRIPLPADTPIVDKRFEEHQKK